MGKSARRSEIVVEDAIGVSRLMLAPQALSHREEAQKYRPQRVYAMLPIQYAQASLQQRHKLIHPVHRPRLIHANASKTGFLHPADRPLHRAHTSRHRHKFPARDEHRYALILTTTSY